MLISLFAFVFCLSFVFGLCFYFVHRYLSFTCRVCSFAQPVPTSSSRRPSRRNACQARRLYSFKGVRPRECEPYPLRRKCRQFDTATNGSLRRLRRAAGSFVTSSLTPKPIANASKES